jgi:hypothetical protein
MFMAPELEHGDKLDVAADVDTYSLGKLIFYMFTGGVVMPREYLRRPQVFERTSASWPGRVTSTSFPDDLRARSSHSLHEHCQKEDRSDT